MDEQRGGASPPEGWTPWTTPGQQQAGPGRADPDPGTTQPLTGGYPGYPPPGPPPPPGYYPYQGYGGYGPPPGGGYGYGGMPPGYGGPPRRRRGVATLITYIAVAALAATAGGLVVSATSSSNSTASPPAAAPANPGTGQAPGTGGGGFGLPGGGAGGAGASQAPPLTAAQEQKVEKAVEPGIVIINSNLQYNGDRAAGTGMIISKNGLVLTNNHVIDATTGLTAKVVGTGRTYQAKWLGYDQGSDIAVIQLEGASNLTQIPVGNSSKVKVGDPVVGMGNANGTGFVTPVQGSITGLNQSITASDQGGSIQPEQLKGMLETNADIISGDSGGPLASAAGQVIGMDTAASTTSNVATQQSTGFAIPINRALTIAHQIISGKSGSGVQIGATGFVGIQVAAGPNNAQSTETSPQGQLQQQQQAQQQSGGLGGGNGGFGGNGGPPQSEGCTQGDTSTLPQQIAKVPSGTLVLGVICDTPADQAGISPGDVITKVAGKQVTSPESLMNVLKGFRGGSRVSLTWVTVAGQTISKTLTVASAPPQ